MDEVRLALRRIIKRPGAALASIVTLGAAIGAAAATASLLSAVLLRPLPVDAPDRLVLFGERQLVGRDAGSLRTNNLYPLYPYVRDSGIFERVAAGGPWDLLASAGGRPQVTSVYFASANFFDVLGVPVPIGRGFRDDEDKRGAALVAVLADRYWRRTFGADADVVGHVVTIAGKSATVVGVAARGFRGLDLADAPEIYLPLNTIAEVADPIQNYFAEANVHRSPTAWVTIIGRISVASTVARAAAQVATLSPPSGPRGPVQYGLIDANTAAVPAMPLDPATLLGVAGLILSSRSRSACVPLGAPRASISAPSLKKNSSQSA